MKKKEVELLQKARKVLLVLIVLWMITVFLLSNQNGEGSGSLSLTIAKWLFHSDTAAQNMQWLVRKGAHMIEFGYGAMLIYGYCLTYPNMSSKKKIGFAFLATILYAATDEIHQSFVDQRAGMITDVLIDAIGAAFGIGVVWLGSRIAIGTEYEMRHPEDSKINDMFDNAGNRSSTSAIGNAVKISVKDLKNKIDKGEKAK